jgi:dTDP-4-dehydrorhamnose 3,5-epimerase
MKKKSLEIPDIKIFESDIYKDDRGLFTEIFNQKSLQEELGDLIFVQDNLSASKKNVLRGLHYQLKNPQDKLVFVTSGKVLDVVVDIRIGSPTYKKWVTKILDSRSMQRLFIPKGFAHGFLSLTDDVIFQYKCSDYYYPDDQFSILWNDKDLNIDWNLQSDPFLSEKDMNSISFSVAEKEGLLPHYNS